jgi:hypothetical protein
MDYRSELRARKFARGIGNVRVGSPSSPAATLAEGFLAY